MDCAPASMSMRAMCSPSCAAWSGGAVASCFTYCDPSTEHTHASSTSSPRSIRAHAPSGTWHPPCNADRSEEHTSELQSLAYLVCRLLLEKKKNQLNYYGALIHRQACRNRQTA